MNIFKEDTLLHFHPILNIELSFNLITNLECVVIFEIINIAVMINYITAPTHGSECPNNLVT